MNYSRVYLQIVDRAKNRKLEDYVERHHILPRSLGGLDTSDNLVNLTAREHFICHLLLVKIYPKSKAMVYAAWCMSNGWVSRGQKNQKKYRVSGTLYQRLKETISEMQKNRVTYKCKHCKSTVERQVSQTQETMFCSRACYLKDGGVTKGELHIYKDGVQKFIPKAKLEEYLREGWEKGRKILHKPVTQYTLQGKEVKKYNSVKEAVTGTDFSCTGISECANGKRNTHKGYQWRY